jgi:hypothetical protein
MEFADAASTIPLMSDTDHLNRFGSLTIVQRLLASGKLRFSGLEYPVQPILPIAPK